jgi:hypothetical protein
MGWKSGTTGSATVPDPSLNSREHCGFTLMHTDEVRTGNRTPRHPHRFDEIRWFLSVKTSAHLYDILFANVIKILCEPVLMHGDKHPRPASI